uniref:Deltamethrin resistance protein prag01 domain-containing protein n=1 Tax=Arion vulgaris TaxID=1028688 RepID=A0A0B6XYI6_9EUPU
MFNTLVPLLRAAPRVQQFCRRSHGVPAHWKSVRQICEENKSHMNFLPVPEGSWQEAFNKKNAKYNQLLALSTLALVVTAGILWQSGSIYLHTSPPTYNIKKKE